MPRSNSRWTGILQAASVALAIVAYARLCNPVAMADLQTCTLAANPCETCAGTNNNHQCLLEGTTYQWGYCSAPANKACAQQTIKCNSTKRYSCGTPPQELSLGCGSGMDPGYTACSY